MSVAAKTYEFVTLELYVHRKELDPIFHEQFEALFARIREDLTKGRDIDESCDELLESLFAIRLKALIWLSKQPEFQLADIFIGVQQLVNELAEQNGLEGLSENLGFALRTVRRVMNSIISKVPELGTKDGAEALSHLPEIDYWTYYDMLSMSIPNQELLENIMEWVDSSLELEYAILATLLLNEENLLVDQKSIDDLSILMALAAQDYGAYAVELGIMPMHISRPNEEYPIPEDSDFIKEQQLLADSGLEDLGPDLDKK